MRTLITGGAGFIGSHLAAALLERGDDVRVVDRLDPQVHPGSLRPAHLPEDVELMVGDVRDAALLDRALDGVDAVVHLASSVGVGQSMYEMTAYTATNDVGTATLLEALIRRPVERLVCASSMSIYGEGAARGADGRVVRPLPRAADDLRAGRWDVRDENGTILTPVATPETTAPSLQSIYAVNKFSQEQMCLVAARAYGTTTIALRFFNVYGPHQALSNPYTGVLAIFASRLLNGRPPMIFEDGRQMRDFVHVRDVARACILALEVPHVESGVFNIGSGEARTVASIGDDLARVLDARLPSLVTRKYRAGDIRHCFADIREASSRLGFRPRVRFDDGLAELADWLRGRMAVDDVDRATAELARRGLVA